MNVVTTSFDTPQDVRFDAETLRYLFLEAAQSGTITPKGVHTYEGHCDPADGSPAIEHVFEAHVLNRETDQGAGPHTGGCLCGDIRYEADDQPVAVVICHCRSCQTSLGSGVNFELLWDPDKFRITKGSPVVHRHRGGSGKALERRFCGTCGTAVWLTGARFDEVGVFRGTLDRPNRIDVSPDTALQIFLSEALPSGMVMAGIEAFAAKMAEAIGAPILLTGVTQGMQVAREDVFGLLAALIRFDIGTEGIGWSNDSDFGLAGYLVTRVPKRAWRVGEALEVGMVGIATGAITTEMTPFGGGKQSVMGREGSISGCDDDLEIKNMCFGGLN